MYKIRIVPDAVGYAVTPDVDVLSVKLDGGLGRYRRDRDGGASTVTAQWTVGMDDYRYLRAFFHATRSGSIEFLVDLVLDEAIPTEYKAHFIPGTWSLRSVQGQTYVVAVIMEVVPTVSVDLGYEEWIVLEMEDQGVFQALEDLVPMFAEV